MVKAIHLAGGSGSDPKYCYELYNKNPLQIERSLRMKDSRKSTTNESAWVNERLSCSQNHYREEINVREECGRDKMHRGCRLSVG